MINKKLLSIIENLEEELIQLFHEFHRHPELSNEEFQTTEKIKKLLTDVEIEMRLIAIEKVLSERKNSE